MLIPTEKVDLPRRVQIFNDYVAEDAAREKRENDDRWRNKALMPLLRLSEVSEIESIGISVGRRLHQ